MKAYLCILHKLKNWVNDRSRHLSNCFITAVSSGRGMQVWNPVRRIKRLSKQQQYKYVLLRACSRSWLWSGVGQVGTLYDTPHLICSPGTGLAHVDFPKLFANAAYYYNEVACLRIKWNFNQGSVTDEHLWLWPCDYVHEYIEFSVFRCIESTADSLPRHLYRDTGILNMLKNQTHTLCPTYKHNKQLGK